MRQFRPDTADYSPTSQRLIRRSFLFVHVPSIVLLVLICNYTWEVVRTNVDASNRADWPLRLTLLDLSTTATLLGVAAGLLLARLQWARANRPSIGYVIGDEGMEFRADSEKWTTWIHNGGPGTAVVEDFRYVVRFTSQPMSVPISLAELNSAMEARGLIDGEDYFIREQGRGAAYPPTASFSEGPKVCWFTVRALAQIEVLNIVIRIKDPLGDTHERTLVVAEKMPSVAVRARDRYVAERR